MNIKKRKQKNFFSNLNKIINLSSYKNFYKTSILSVIVICIFFSLPISTKLVTKTLKINKIIVSYSGITFDQVAKESLKKKEQKELLDIIKQNINNQKDMFADIDFYSKDEEGINAPILNAITIEELFKSEGYTLQEVRSSKKVNIGFSIPRLPLEIKNIENVKKKKELFIQIILPLILEENTSIKVDRIKLFSILNKKYNSPGEKEWLNKKFKQYGVKNRDLSELKIRMDEIPVSLAIAQAAKETGWGTSRFAQQGNALFGQWTWTGEGIKPAGIEDGAKHKVAKFKILKASVRAYQRNLNTHPSYSNFRKERAIQRENENKLNSHILVNFLDKYAETGDEYIKVLKQIIKQNSLTDFDDVKILPTSKKLKNLI